jgi:cobalamin biosynthesis protein CobD/CbiB
LKFLSVVAALLLEQVRPLRQGNRAYVLFTRYATSLERHFNGGQGHHGIVAWLLAVLPPVAATLAIYLLLSRVSLLLGWTWNIAVLYFTMGFRQFSHFFTEILQALQEGRLDRARDYLREWRGESAAEFSSNEIARVAIEQGLVSSHRHVFGPVASFIILGPAGAVLYRTAAILADKWSGSGQPEFGEFGRFAEHFFFWLDWLPSRITAASFAIVGNFEDAVYCWRTQARSWQMESLGIILSSGAGAIGVRLGDTARQHGSVEGQPEVGGGDEADVDYMQSAVGLIWRALVLWLFVVLLVTVAHSLGG